jgi:hypothetical protein
MYRFVTPHRCGKWYPDLLTAQQQANAIGAGFLEPKTEQFYQYAGTRLETQVVDVDDESETLAA